MAYGLDVQLGVCLGFVFLWLTEIAHTQRGAAGHIEFYNDYGSNHDEERVSL